MSCVPCRLPCETLRNQDNERLRTRGRCRPITYTLVKLELCESAFRAALRIISSRLAGRGYLLHARVLVGDHPDPDHFDLSIFDCSGDRSAIEQTCSSNCHDCSRKLTAYFGSMYQLPESPVRNSTIARSDRYYERSHRVEENWQGQLRRSNHCI